MSGRSFRVRDLNPCNPSSATQVALASSVAGSMVLDLNLFHIFVEDSEQHWQEVSSGGRRVSRGGGMSKLSVELL